MPIPTNIRTLLSGNVVEWARIEFKETWDAEASLKTICAFANDIDNWGGGYIVIGVEEENGLPKRPLKGVPLDKIDGYQKEILNACKRIQPEYMPIVEVADYDGKKFIVIWAPGGYLRPYQSPRSMVKDEKVRIPFIRKMSSTVQPSMEETRDLYALANRVPFDDRINHEAELSDLNITLIQEYLRQIDSSLYENSGQMDFLELCRSMNIVNNLPEYTKPKNVGLMFFSVRPDKFFPYAQIEVVQFPEGEGGQKIEERIFKGPLHHQLQEALLYISNSVLEEHVLKHSDRPDADRFFNYPYEAIKEALANAVYHKGYDVREPIEVRVLTDRIEIISHPGAERSVSQEGLMNYRVFNRCYRNRRIGEFLKEMHLTEGRNTGFRKILNALEHNGSPKPLFETDEARTFFATTIFIHPDFADDARHSEGNEEIKHENEGINSKNEGINSKNEGINSKNEGINSNNEGINSKNEGINSKNEGIKELREKEGKILSLIRKDSQMSIAELEKASSLSHSTVERCLKSLKEKGIIYREGAKRNGSWVILTKSDEK